MSVSNNSVRIALPPPTMVYWRMLAVTLVALLWRYADYRWGPCKLSHKFDSNKYLDYVEITCINTNNLNQELAKECDIGAKIKDVTKNLYDNINILFEFNKKLNIINIKIGMPSTKSKQKIPKIKNYRKNIINLVKDSVRLMYARWPPLFNYQNEKILNNSNRIMPLSAMIDFDLYNLSPYTFQLNKIYYITSKFDNIFIAIADLGDLGPGLRDAVDYLFKVNYNDGKCSFSLNNKSIDLPDSKLVGQHKYSGNLLADLLYNYIDIYLIFRILKSILEGSIEVVAGWPSIAIVKYVGEHGRMGSISIISSSGITSSLLAAESAAQTIGSSVENLIGWIFGFMKCGLRLAVHGNEELASLGEFITREVSRIANMVLAGRVDVEDIYRFLREVSPALLSAIKSGAVDEMCATLLGGPWG